MGERHRGGGISIALLCDDIRERLRALEGDEVGLTTCFAPNTTALGLILTYV
jgi:hypothetical protein